MISAYQQPVMSNPATDFTEQLVTNAGSANVDLTLPGKDALWFIRAIALIAVQNLAYELQLFTSADNMGPTIATDNFLATWEFGAITSGPPAGAGYPFDVPDVTPQNGYYHYYIDGNMMPYYDKDQMNLRNPVASQPLGVGFSNYNIPPAKLHVRLINRSSTTKNADASGALQVIFYVATQGMQV